jgi:hypothetical protein
MPVDNSCPQNAHVNRLAANWRTYLLRHQAARTTKHLRQATSFDDILGRATSRPPAEPPPVTESSGLMTNFTNSDVSVSSDDNSMDSLPGLSHRSDSSSDFSISYPIGRGPQAYDDDSSISSTMTDDTGDSTISDNWVEKLGPPPPGSLMSFWDQPIYTTDFCNFDYFKPVASGYSAGSTIPTTSISYSDVSDDDNNSVCSWDIPNPKNTGRGAIPTFFRYHHIQLCGVSLSTVWGVREARYLHLACNSEKLNPTLPATL